MTVFFRETAAGQLLRFSFGHHAYVYREEDDNFAITQRDTQAQHDSFGDVTSIDDEKEIVGWYGASDPENPYNWSQAARAYIVFIISLYTFTVYMGSAIYTASLPGVMAHFNVSEIVANLGLALYVLGFGLGPMIFSPLSELPSIGRNVIYIVTLFVSLLFMIAAALAPNFGALLVFRFLAAFFGSPAIATGGATIQDVYPIRKIPYGIAAWVAAATMGPALGPLLGGFAASAKDWRWPLWIQVWLAAPVFVIMFFTLPETSESFLLKRRAKRIRKRADMQAYRSAGEIEEESTTMYSIVQTALIRPIQIAVLDTGTGFINVYLAFVYAIYYSFFECFPLIYPVYYGFNLGQTGLTFVSIVITTLIGSSLYSAYLYYYVEPKIEKEGLPPLEERLMLAIPASMLMPVGLFLFAWTARPSVHWSVALIGVGIYGLGLYLLIQCALLYVPLVYPKYGASLLAANDCCRSSLAAGFVLFGRPLFLNLGIGGGVSLLAGLSCLCIPGIILIYIYGASLRRKSRFASSMGEPDASAKEQMDAEEATA